MYKAENTLAIEDDAQAIAKILDAKASPKSIVLKVGQNLIGSLGEAYCRKYLEDFGVINKWHSFEKTEKGNPLDFTILRPTTSDITIDVKASGMRLDWNNIENTKHVVLVSQWEHIYNGVDYMVFVRNYQSSKTKCGYIMGAISVREFNRVKFRHDMKMENYACLQSDLIKPYDFIKLLKKEN